ncbi:histidine kinase [Saccharopolyspora sp. WRP15-2]|uniref:histidine kinase n=1 Tax=Saccharopolyspora oryzae TaxID=2997343 RepID=A0ABT4USX1_9PSEU|nr:histidine kinase [Saccharopolyspora oryzae]MDA3624821.1 histidine kinase [Saccharopolyspora oryzae]
MGSLDTRRGWLTWWDGKFRSLALDVAVALSAAFFVDRVERVSLTGADEERRLVLLGVLVVVALALLVRRRFPWLAVAASAGAVLTPTTAATGIFTPIAMYTIARRRGPGAQLWTATEIVFAANGTQLIWGPHGPLWDSPLRALPYIAYTVMLSASPVLLGLWLRQREKLLAALQERAEQAERERDLLAERAVATERRRIAREMHDVIAHRCSVISLQAGALSVSAPDERTGEVAEVIRKTSATALTELRSMLRVLRDDDAEHRGETPDDPTVGSIEALVADSIESGANIRLDMPEQLPETSGEVGRAAYRVVQEALTNAAKHAPHSAVRVEVAAEGEELVVAVSNQRGRSTDTDAVPGSGYGLIGMRERVTLAGGTLRTGWAEDGGYRVRAMFPLGDEVAA